MTTLFVYMNGREVGEYIRKKSGAEEFHYASTWLERAQPIPLSRSLPLTEQVHKGDAVINYFDNLLPDSLDIRRRIQARFQVKTRRPFDLLAAIGRDCVGAIQLLPERGEPEVRKIAGIPLTDQDIGTTLRHCKQRPLGMSEDDGADFRISLAGVQEKTALLRHQGQWFRPLGATPTTHILKLPIGRIESHDLDLSDSPENEFLCLNLLKGFGLPVPEMTLACFDAMTVLVVERFDRASVAGGAWIARLPQEDMCQALGISPALKYEQDGGPGIAEIMALLNAAATPLESRYRFMKSVYLFWVLGAIDGHAKNFSIFLHPHGNFALTPLYDVISAYPLVAKRQIDKHGLHMAMRLRGKNSHYRWRDIMPRHWLSTADKVYFPRVRMTAIIDEVRETAAQVIDNVMSRLPTGFSATIADALVKGMLDAIHKNQM